VVGSSLKHTHTHTYINTLRKRQTTHIYGIYSIYHAIDMRLNHFSAILDAVAV